MRRRRSVLAAAVAGALVAGAVPLAAPAHAITPGGWYRFWHPTNGFSRLGVWNTKIPRDVPLAPNSAAIVNNIAIDKRDNYGTWGINTDTYSTPIFQVGLLTPRQKWTWSNCLGEPEQHDTDASFASVPTPANLFVSQGTDEAVTIYQPATDSYWDFWRAEKDADGHWSACWGGKIDHYSQNPGIFPHPLGATATGLPIGAFTIRIEELSRGFIDHALNIATVRTQAGCTSWPASRNDGNTEGADIPCEGQRFRLDPTFDISTLPNPTARVIAKAMQDYGLILTDKAGAVVTYAEDPRVYYGVTNGRNLYPDLLDPLHRIPDGWEQYLVLAGIPIERLQALPIDWGKPASVK